MPQRHLPLRIATAAIFLVSLNGCINVDDAAGLSKLADETRVSLPRISNDVAGTCLRQNALFENTPANERAPNAQPQDCPPYREIARHLGQDENVLAAYFDALRK